MKSGIGDVGIAHRERVPRRFEHDVEALGAGRIERGEIEPLEDVQHHQRGEPLPVRRHLDHVESAVVGADRLGGLAAMARQIVRREKAAPRRHGRHDVVGDRALVEGARAVPGDRRQGRGERGKPDHVAGRRRAAAEQEVARRPRVMREARRRLRPVTRDARRDRKTLLGVADGGRQRAIEPEAAVRLEDRGPRLDRARHRHGVDGIAADLARCPAP